MFVFSNGEKQRLLFHTSHQLEKEEEEKYEQFLEWLKRNGHELEDHYLTDEREGLRFLAANRWNIERTWEDI